jgi:hypothetical protein
LSVICCNISAEQLSPKLFPYDDFSGRKNLKTKNIKEVAFKESRKRSWLIPVRHTLISRAGQVILITDRIWSQENTQLTSQEGS